MKRIKVKNVSTLITKEASIVRSDATVMQIAKEIVRDPKTRSVYVADEDNKLLGIIPVINLVEYLFYEYMPDEIFSYKALNLLGDVRAKDIMLPPVYVKETDTLGIAFQKMFSGGFKEIPVVDNNIHIVGDLNILELITVWINENS